MDEWVGVIYNLTARGCEGPGVSEERELATEPSGPVLIYNPHSTLSVEKQRQKLPVFKHRNNILYLVESFQTVVIVGETGCGKSTQIPQYLLEAGWAAEGKVIGVTQPRRVAATSDPHRTTTAQVANRVAEERGALLGHEVGYTIRFDDCSDPHATRIKFLTDGMLVREMMADPLLKKYSVLMLDEAHERTLYTDIALGLLKKIQRKRRDLRLIVASATLDAKKFQDFFNLNESGDPSKDTCGILTVEGRTFPVDVFYTVSPVPDYVKATVETVLKIHEAEEDGDVLAFLTGQEEVEKVVSMLQEQARTLSRYGIKKHLRVLPMYAGLPYAEQMRVFERMPPTVRKVVVATNIAETSITINGIVFVIDCAFVKLRAYNPRTAIESLVVTPISKASAAQRAGRAGRNRPGKCFRLYTEEDFEKLPESTVPEMQRSNLAPVILQLKALGIDNVLRFSFLSPPPAQSMVQALELLYALGGLDQYGRLTEPMGVRMAEFPLSPMFAKMLLESGNFGCSKEIVTIAAMMQIQNIFVVPSDRKKAADPHRTTTEQTQQCCWTPQCHCWTENRPPTRPSGTAASCGAASCGAASCGAGSCGAVSCGAASCGQRAEEHCFIIQHLLVFLSRLSVSVGLSAPQAREHRKFAVAEGDHLTMLNVYEAFVKGDSHSDWKICTVVIELLSDGLKSLHTSSVLVCVLQHQKSSQWCQERFLNYKGLVRAMTVREQLRRLLNKFKVPRTSSEGDPDVILRCIVSGFFANAARLHHSGSYRTLRDDRELHIHPNSVLYGEKPPKWYKTSVSYESILDAVLEGRNSVTTAFRSRCVVLRFMISGKHGAWSPLGWAVKSRPGNWDLGSGVEDLEAFGPNFLLLAAAELFRHSVVQVVFNEVVQTSKYFMRDVTAVESAWLVELAPHFYKQAKSCVVQPSADGAALTGGLMEDTTARWRSVMVVLGQSARLSGQQADQSVLSRNRPPHCPLAALAIITTGR
ncbi:hypothetical protein NFI96_013074 [Prochilodus magdalenae]|nr:hypothetical protein NFI96_013074 [Prochilodus magdalenae]